MEGKAETGREGVARGPSSEASSGFFAKSLKHRENDFPFFKPLVFMVIYSNGLN